LYNDEREQTDFLISLGMHQIQFQSNPNPIPESDLTGFDKSWIWIWLDLTRIGFEFDWIWVELDLDLTGFHLDLTRFDWNWLRFVLNYSLSPPFLLYENTPRFVLSILCKHHLVLISYIMKVPLAPHSLLFEGTLVSSLSVIYVNQI
jgi:hypothetical protein